MAIILDADEFILKTRKNKLVNELDELDLDEPVVLISNNRPKKEKKKEKKLQQEDETEEDVNDWLSTVANFKSEPIRKKRSPSNVFNYYTDSKKHKKKKDKKKGELTDYTKEFDLESRLIKDLMADQSKFVDSLQKKYDIMENTKSSARGVGKFTTDLIESINTGRKLSLDLIKEQAGLKKTIADLTMKEKKEFGSTEIGDDNLSLYSSSLLKKMISESHANGSDNDIGISDDIDTNELYEGIHNIVGENDDDAEIEKYLKYESSKVTIWACINETSGVNYFVAKDEKGNVVDDYPLPEMTELTINRSTEIATDIYSRKYPIIWIS
jgi:hypothetical protein